MISSLTSSYNNLIIFSFNCQHNLLIIWLIRIDSKPFYNSSWTIYPFVLCLPENFNCFAQKFQTLCLPKILCRFARKIHTSPARKSVRSYGPISNIFSYEISTIFLFPIFFNAFYKFQQIWYFYIIRHQLWLLILFNIDYQS